MKCRNARRAATVLGGALLLVGGALGAEGFTPGHIFVHDNVWRDATVLEYDANGQLVRDFRDSLPAGYVMGGMGHMQFGADGHLYQYGELLIPDPEKAEWETGVFEWGPGGELLNFYGTGETLYPAGFTVMDNDNWFMTGPDGAGGEFVREYARDFSGYTGFTFTGAGFEGACTANGEVWAVSNHAVHQFNLDIHEEWYSFSTSEDSNQLAISPGGRIAVNQQWPGTLPERVEIYDPMGYIVASCPMPNDQTRCYSGLAFDANEDLYVAACEDDPGRAAMTRLIKYSAFDGYQTPQMMTLSGWREVGSIAVFVPEPATLILLAFGGLVLRRH